MDSNVELIALVRHGRSTANEDPHVYQVLPDHAIPLARPDDDPDAAIAGAALATVGLDPAAVCSWRSPYLRCAQTEALVMRRALGAAFADVHRRDSFLLREQEFGDWDGYSEAEMAAASPAQFARRTRMSDHHGRFYFRYPSGESRADVVQRLALFMGKLHRSEHRQHVIFLHGVTQRAFRMAWFNHGVEWFEDEPNPANCSVTIIARAPDHSWCERTLDC
ncbi:MAG TPA: histidine phosphatase family protein [Kofleriaceae bacterium]|nr:histidine phosphatase family protein [Kofleriaceae bacterium]